MNIAPDPKSIPQGSLLSPDANQQAALPTANGILTVDLDVVMANAYGCGAEQVSRALASAGCKTFFVAGTDEAAVVRTAAPAATIYVLGGFFQNTGDAYARLDCRPVIGDL